jgi:O-antigen/teichoic acid export membrane protein
MSSDSLVARIRPVTLRAARNSTTLALAASLAARGVLLLQLVASGWLLGQDHYDTVAVSIAVSASLQVLTEAGGTAYLSIVDDGGYRRSIARIARLEGLTSIVATVVASALVLARTHGSGGGAGEAAVVAIAAVAGIESFARFARIPWLREEQVGRYAAVDLLLAGARLLSIAGMLAGLGLWSFCLGAAGSLVVAAWPVRRALLSVRRLPAAESMAATLSRSTIYGLPIIAAGIYSQLPAIMVTAFGTLVAASVVATATRLVQPLEVLAVSYTQRMLPRLATGQAPGGPFLRRTTLLSALGLAGGAVVGAVVLWSTHQRAEGWIATGVLLGALPLKFFNYGQATLLMAAGSPSLRLLVSLVSGVLCVATLVLVVHQGPIAVSAVMAGNEVVLGAGLRLALRISSRERQKR